MCAQFTAGYSKKTLVQKLGIQPGARIAFQNEPDHYRSLLGTMPEGVRVYKHRAAELDFIHVFAKNFSQLRQGFPRAKRRIKPDGMVWISWPKLTSPLKADLNEDLVRDTGLAHGMVDVKVAAIDEDWSGLKFVFRLEDRP